MPPNAHQTPEPTGSMKHIILMSALALGAAGAVPVAAQSGFALKGSAVFNSSSVETSGTDLDLDDSRGFNVGAEFVLPMGVGVGVSGYTAGSPNDFDTSEGSLIMLGELNYFFNLPLLPITPYAGVHVGLGSYDLADVQGRVTPDVDFGDRGWQVGLRFQPIPLIGIDAQYRRVSGSLEEGQDSEFETNQVLLGITLF